jgi:hypothetical protein
VLLRQVLELGVELEMRVVAQAAKADLIDFHLWFSLFEG